MMRKKAVAVAFVLILLVSLVVGIRVVKADIIDNNIIGLLIAVLILAVVIPATLIGLLIALSILAVVLSNKPKKRR